MIRYLIVVSRTQPRLYEHLVRNFAGDPQTQVILDRRVGERRQADRRRRPSTVEEDLDRLGVAIVRLDPIPYSHPPPSRTVAT